MAELLYANQKPQDVASLTAFAHQLHLDVGRFRHDLDSSSVAAELDADMEESSAFAIEQTPTLFINGKTLVGYQSEQTLAGLIDTAAAQNIVAPATAPDSVGETLDPALLAEIQSRPTAAQGAADAPLTIVEFTDFQCPYCRGAVTPMEQFMASRGREVRWIVRTFPLDIPPDSELRSEAALAVRGAGQVLADADLLFANQTALKLENLRAYAEQLHLDMHTFNDALATHRFAGQIASDRMLGTKAGVDGTPTFVIDGHLMSGARSLPELNQIADAHTALAAGRSLAAAAVPVTPPAATDQQVSGPANHAPITLTWFTDVRSPLASRQADLVRALVAQYDGKVRVFFRAFPLESHADGRIGSAALLAALSQGKFWPMFDALAERRDLWTAPSCFRSQRTSASARRLCRQSGRVRGGGRRECSMRRPGVAFRAPPFSSSTGSGSTAAAEAVLHCHSGSRTRDPAGEPGEHHAINPGPSASALSRMDRPRSGPDCRAFDHVGCIPMKTRPQKSQ